MVRDVLIPNEVPQNAKTYWTLRLLLRIPRPVCEQWRGHGLIRRPLEFCAPTSLRLCTDLVYILGAHSCQRRFFFWHLVGLKRWMCMLPTRAVSLDPTTHFHSQRTKALQVLKCLEEHPLDKANSPTAGKTQTICCYGNNAMRYYPKYIGGISKLFVGGL